MLKKLYLAVALVLVMGSSPVRAEETVPDKFAQQQDDNSMLESYNRAMFSFNNHFNHYVLMPVSRAYREITTPFVRKRVRGLLSNLREPLYAGNYVLQGNLKQTGISLSRFVINSTLGLFGMFDVAEAWGLKKDTTGFDDTFAEWCIPDGPYIVLPFLGSSTPRAAVGTSLGFVFDPVFWTTYHDANVNSKISYSYAALQAITLMEENMDLLNDFERNSVDFYETVKSAYLQNRKNKGCFGKDMSSSVESYDFDFDIDEEYE